MKHGEEDGEKGENGKEEWKTIEFKQNCLKIQYIWPIIDTQLNSSVARSREKAAPIVDPKFTAI
jgi:hypothetical protein